MCGFTFQENCAKTAQVHYRNLTSSSMIRAVRPNFIQKPAYLNSK